mgnify:CR=1 FL=1
MVQNLSGDVKIQAVEINSLVVSESSKELFSYEEKTELVNELAKQIQANGIYTPLAVAQQQNHYVVVDGVLRYLALKSLNLNSVECFVLNNVPESAEDFKVLIISFNLKSIPSPEEKKRIIIHYLRLNDSDKKLDGKTFEV